MIGEQPTGHRLGLEADPAQYLPMVMRHAKRLARRLPAHVEVGDLVGAGVLGLMEALRRFDPQRAVSFDSYAAFRVRGAMLDELRRRDLMARDARRESKQLQGAIQSLRLQLGRSPEDAELAEALGIDEASLTMRLQKLPVVSISSIDEQSVDEPAEQTPSAFDVTAKRQLQAQLVDALGMLTERSQRVLQLYYREGLTLKQIGEVLQISESRVSQIMSKAVLELRGILEAEPNRSLS